MNTRILWADQAKALAIWLMVICHFGLPYPDIVNFIYIFHMPLFFFISGYFDKGTSLNLTYVKKCFKALIVPYFFFSICAFSICWVSPYLHPELYNNDGLPKTFLKAFVGMFLMEDRVRPYAFMPLGPLWFLVALFEVKILFSLMIKIWRFKKVGILVPIALCGLLFCHKFPYFSLDSACMALPIYFVGYICRKYNIIENVSQRWIAGLIWLAGLIYLIVIGLQNGRIDMDGAQYGNHLSMFYVNAIVGSISVVFLFKSLNINWGGLECIGKRTLSILGTHTYVGKVGTFIGVFFFSMDPRTMPMWYVIVMSGVALLVGVLVDKFLNKHIPFVLGK